VNELSAQTVRILEHLVEKPHIMKMFEIEMSNNVMMLLHILDWKLSNRTRAF